MDTATASPNPNATAKPHLAQGLRDMINETDHFLKAAAASGDEKFDAMREKFVGQVRQMRAQLDEFEETALYRAKHAARAADRSVHEHPYGAMGIAAAAGVLIGLLAARR